MICKVKRTIEKYGLLASVKSVAVGVSGGADSMCLLSILNSLSDEFDITVKAVHINHNLRGDEALRDENFVRDFCRKHQIKLHVFSEDIKAQAKQLGIGEEECGRIVRYKRFSEIDADVIATAHSLSDSIETILFNLARGTALKGLCGIPAKREPNIIRPLIECTRKEIESYCEKESVPFIIDSTNLSDDYMRNHIRHNLIPDVSKVNSSFEKSILRCMQSLSADEDFLHRESEKLLESISVGDSYNISILKQAHPSLRRRVISIILNTYMNKSVESKHIELLEDIIMKSKGQLEIGKHLYIFVNNDIMLIRDADMNIQPWRCNFVADRAVTPVGTYILCKCSFNQNYAIDADKFCSDIYFSSRQEGDRFTSKRRGVTKSLKKLFNEMKIPANERNSIPVLHDGDSVVYVEGIGVNAFYQADENSENIITVKREG